MGFVSDSQRRAAFANMARFSNSNSDILSGNKRSDVAMLAKFEKNEKKLDELLNDPKMMACKKYDGVRAMAVGVDGKISIFNPRKGGDDMSWKFPEVVNGLNQLLDEDVSFIVDGEIVSSVHDKNDFHNVIARVNTDNSEKVMELVDENPMVYKIFDVLELNDVDTTDMTLEERKSVLSDIIGNGNKFVSLEECTFDDKVDFANKYIESGGEGIVIKDPNSKYEMGARSGSWTKYKAADDDTFVVYGFERGSGKNSDRVGSILIGKFDNGEFVAKGKVGSGLKYAERKYLWDKYGGDKKDVVTIPDSKWFGVDIKYMEEDSHGGLRQPRIERLREDLSMGNTDDEI